MEQKTLQSYAGTVIDDRPWGHMERFTHNEPSTVKLVRIYPNQMNSLQYHNHRAEFWKIIKGPAMIVLGDKTMKAKDGDEIFVPPKMAHRWGAYDTEVILLEIAFGHQDENDIVRLEDKYKRA